MFRKRIKLAFILAILLAFATVSIAIAEVTLVIDHFDTNDSVLLTWNGTPITGFSALADPTVLGGERDIVGNLTDGVQNGETLSIISNNADNSLLSITNGNNIGSVSELQYDGDDPAPKSNLDPVGLGGEDLEALGDRFIVSIVFDDLPTQVIFTAYTDGTNYSTYTESLPGLISALNPYVFEIPFTSFTTAGGSGVDFSNLGALTVQVDANNPASYGLDLTLHFLAIADGPGLLDFDDLPDSYGTLLASNGARNYVGIDTVLLGSSITLEAEGKPSDGANAEGPSDDGVVRTPGVHWVPGADGGSVDITVSQCQNEPCYVSAWIDWDNSGTFEPGEQIFSNQAVNNTTDTFTFDIPGTVTVNDNVFYARFRVYDVLLSAPEPDGLMISGETEGYVWYFGPTAIDLISLEAKPNYDLPFALLAATILLVLGGGAMLFFKRRRA